MCEGVCMCGCTYVCMYVCYVMYVMYDAYAIFVLYSLSSLRVVRDLPMETPSTIM